MKKITKFQLLCYLLVIGISFSSYSQQEKHLVKDTINIEEVVVTGTPVKVNKNNVPMSISIISREQITESNESSLLPVLSGRVPGLFVTERGITGFGVATGAAGQISIRGIGGSPTTGVLMLIDGHPQFMGIMGHPLPDGHVASDVEKVEIIRGPGSMLYGSNAMGGVINIITRKQTQDGVHGNGRVMFGSYDTQKYMAAAGFKSKGFSIFTSVNHDQTDGHRPNSDFKITNGYVKVGYEMNKNLRANADFSIAKFTATDPGPDTINAKPGSSLDITRGYCSLALENEYDKVSGAAKIFYNFGEHKISDGFHSKDANYGLNLYQSVKLFEGSSLSIGTDYLDYGGKAENEKAMDGKGMVFKDTTIYEVGVYGFIQQKIFNKLTLNAGLRLQNHEVFGNEWIPSVGFALRLTNETTWKGSVSKGFRSPTIRELYMWNHNPDLKPESVINYETGIFHSIYNHKLNIELTGFVIKGDNLIVTGEMGKLFNSGKVSNKGIEFAINAKPINNLFLNIAYGFINPEFQSFATPKHNLFISGSYRLKKFQLNLSLQQIAGLDTDSSSLTNTESYTLLHAKLSFQIFRFLDVFVNCENFLNQKYEINRYYPMPGATAFGGLNMKF